ncbi:hypothetical protein GALL_428330 [mine drainage metagenome]|uniref:Uncharacterized protein n=1 Tax=mine drainage metagenome TaxID=410659 RepID=A0A1J5Q682_9ZZZZ
MSPREMSRSSASVKVTDIGAKACCRSPSKVTMLLICEVSPEGSTVTASPTLTEPDSMRPM